MNEQLSWANFKADVRLSRLSSVAWCATEVERVPCSGLTSQFLEDNKTASGADRGIFHARSSGLHPSIAFSIYFAFGRRSACCLSLLFWRRRSWPCLHFTRLRRKHLYDRLTTPRDILLTHYCICRVFLPTSMLSGSASSTKRLWAAMSRRQATSSDTEPYMLMTRVP